MSTATPQRAWVATRKGLFELQLTGAGSTTGGLWASGDAGDHWQMVSLNLPPIAAVRFG